MDERQGRAIGGSCLGGVLGGLLGILLGGAIGHAMVDPPKKDDRLPITTGFFSFLGNLLQLSATLAGAGVGGIAGAIGGSMVGAGVAAKRRRLQAHDRLADSGSGEAEADELARLKARIAELERQKGEGH
jgi:hypothetical protein